MLGALQAASSCEHGHSGRSPPQRLRLSCAVLRANTSLPSKVRAARWADALVHMWGGDTLVGLHMRRGSLLLELRDAVFVGDEQDAPTRSWLTQQRSWVMRLPDGEAPPLRFVSLDVPEDRGDSEREAAALALQGGSEARCCKAQLLRQEATLAQLKAARSCAEGVHRWYCAWNMNRT